jgi:hypothetical protein
MPHSDIAAATREWLFKSEGQVFGPVPEPQLVELLLQGRLTGQTPISGSDGAWHPLRDVPGFLVHLRKAEAKARVEAEVTGARSIARRRGALQGALLALAALLLVGLFGAGAFFLAVRRPWERRSALLEDFGDGIAVSTARIGAGARASAADDEIAIPEVPPGGAGAPEGAAPAAKRRVASAARPPPRAAGSASGTAEGGDLVMAQYDPARIQAVVARRQSSLAACLREEAHRSPEFAGDIPIDFAVGNAGRVVALWIDEPRFKSGELRDCLLRRLKEWEFDRFPGQRPVVSLSFRIGAH